MARNFNTRATPRLHGGNYILLLPRSSCAVLHFNSTGRGDPVRQPTSPASTVQTLRGGRMLKFYHADLIMKFVFQYKVCTCKYLGLSIVQLPECTY